MFIAVTDNNMQMGISFEISNAIVENQFNVLILTFNIINHVFCSSLFGTFWLHQHTSDLDNSPQINTMGLYF